MDSQRSDDSDNLRRHILPRAWNLGMLFCGSFYEQPMEYAMLSFTDLDTMFFERKLIATTNTRVISKSFDGEVLTIESKNCHLGFARLLRRRGEITEHFLWSRKSLKGPSAKKSVMTSLEVSSILRAVLNYIPNLKAYRELTVDHVFSVLCPHWPSEADEWRTRKRNSGWPTRDMIDKVVHGGCHLVPKSHESNQDDDTCWRYSFSHAEFILLDSWNEVQKYIYHILRLLKSDVVEKCGGEENTFLCTYYIKTLMMWACEEKPPSFWSGDRIEEAIDQVLQRMIECFTDKCCPNYFIRDNNMFDYLKSDFDVSVEVALLNASRLDIPKVVARHPKVYRGKMLHIRVSDKSLLLCQLAINRRFFVNPLDHTSGRYTVKDLASSRLLRCEVEHILRAVQLHRLLMSDLSSSEAEIGEERKSYETEALGCFKKSFERKVTNNYTDVFISSLDSLSSMSNKFLNGKHGENSQRMYFSRPTDEGKVTTEAMEALCQTLVSILDMNHHNPSYFITAAYYANFYYTYLKEYGLALKICVKALKCFSELQDVLGLHTIEEAITNEMLCMFINSQYAGIYDAGIEVVFGFLTLCVGIIFPNDKSSSDRNLVLHDLVFQMCPVEFLKYIQIRCRNKSQPIESVRPRDRNLFYETDTKRDIGGITDLKKLSNSILSAAIIVDSDMYYRSNL